jgi:hypothetical protein
MGVWVRGGQGGLGSWEVYPGVVASFCAGVQHHHSVGPQSKGPKQLLLLLLTVVVVVAVRLDLLPVPPPLLWLLIVRLLADLHRLLMHQPMLKRHWALTKLSQSICTAHTAQAYPAQGIRRPKTTTKSIVFR